MCKNFDSTRTRTSPVCFYEAAVLPSAPPRHTSRGIIGVEECCAHIFTPIFSVFKKSIQQKLTVILESDHTALHPVKIGPDISPRKGSPSVGILSLWDFSPVWCLYVLNLRISYVRIGSGSRLLALHCFKEWRNGGSKLPELTAQKTKIREAHYSTE